MDRQSVDGADVFPDQAQEEELNGTHEKQTNDGRRQTHREILSEDQFVDQCTKTPSKICPIATGYSLG